MQKKTTEINVQVLLRDSFQTFQTLLSCFQTFRTMLSWFQTFQTLLSCFQTFQALFSCANTFQTLLGGVHTFQTKFLISLPISWMGAPPPPPPGILTKILSKKLNFAKQLTIAVSFFIIYIL